MKLKVQLMKEKIRRSLLISSIQSRLQLDKMCLLSPKIMDLPNNIIHQLKSIMERQRTFYNQMNLKDLCHADFELYTKARARCIEYIKVPHVFFGAQADTFATAVAILDVFLWKVKVTEKHMNIVAVACFYIAAKMLEADEIAPTARDLASLHCWTGKDLSRMELHILKKLNWQVCTVTYFSVLPPLADVYGLEQDLVLSSETVLLAQRFLARHSTVMVTPVVLALAIVEHLVGETASSPLESQVRVHCNVEDGQLKECAKTLSTLAEVTITPPPSPPRLTPKFPMKIFDKPSMLGVTPLYTISEESSLIQV